MSHPAGIALRLSLRISRTRRRMRFRTTAPPSARPTLIPKRLSSRPFGAKKMVNWRLERRRPLRYTASNSLRRTSRADPSAPFRRPASAGCPPFHLVSPNGEAIKGGQQRRASLKEGSPIQQVGTALDPGERVAPLPAARRKHLPPPWGFHPRAEAVGFVAAAHLGLKRPFRQGSLSSMGFGAVASHFAPSDGCETASVNAASDRVKESSVAGSGLLSDQPPPLTQRPVRELGPRRVG